VTAKWPDGSDLLRWRLMTLQLDPEQFSPAEFGALRDLQRVCTMCGGKNPCEHDLARDTSSADWRSYCPNVDTLDALQSESTARKLAESQISTSRSSGYSSDSTVVFAGSSGAPYPGRGRIPSARVPQVGQIEQDQGQSAIRS
jgi:hypothetical protein